MASVCPSGDQATVPARRETSVAIGTVGRRRRRGPRQVRHRDLPHARRQAVNPRPGSRGISVTQIAAPSPARLAVYDTRALSGAHAGKRSAPPPRVSRVTRPAAAA